MKRFGVHGGDGISYEVEEKDGKWYKADGVDAKVRKLKMDIEEARGDSSLQIFLCGQFIEEILKEG